MPIARVLKLSNPFIAATLIALSLAASGHLIAAPSEPSVSDVYQATLAGKYSEAQAMMDNILRNHPDSSKAHYVEAQLLSRQNRFSEAKAELDTATRLTPSMTFAKPESVVELKSRIDAGLMGTKGPDVAQVVHGDTTTFNAAAVHFQRGEALIKAHDYAGAASELESAVREEPDNLTYSTDLALAYVQTNQSEKAVLLYEHICPIVEKTYGMSSGRTMGCDSAWGYALDMSGNTAGAIEKYKIGYAAEMASQPTDFTFRAISLDHLSAALKKLGRSSEIIPYCQQLLADAPPNWSYRADCEALLLHESAASPAKD